MVDLAEVRNVILTKKAMPQLFARSKGAMVKMLLTVRAAVIRFASRAGARRIRDRI
jgi:hypothetical protein